MKNKECRAIVKELWSEFIPMPIDTSDWYSIDAGDTRVSPEHKKDFVRAIGYELKGAYEAGCEQGWKEAVDEQHNDRIAAYETGWDAGYAEALCEQEKSCFNLNSYKSVVRSSDGQLGILMAIEGKQIVAYGWTTTGCEPCFDLNIENWREFTLQPGAWVIPSWSQYTWYKVKSVDGLAVKLEDFHDELVMTAALQVNVIAAHYLGERVWHIPTGVECEITKITSYERSLLAFNNLYVLTPMDKSKDAFVALDYEVYALPYYDDQLVAHKQGGVNVYLVNRIGFKLIDGAMRVAEICMTNESETGITVTVDQIIPLIKLDCNKLSGGEIYIDPSDITQVNDIMQNYSIWLTDYSKQQILSIAKCLGGLE